MISTPADRPGPLSDAHRFQLLVDAVSDYAIYMLDPAGHVASWNTGAQKIKGYRADEIIGRSYARFFTPEDQGKGVPARNLDEARRSGRLTTEGWRVRKDGTRFWALAVLHPILDESGEFIGFAKVTRDLTEKLNAQERLFESERRFRLLVEGILDYAIYMLDASGQITNWNAGAQRMKGYSADEIIGQHFSRFYTREDRAAGLPYRNLDIASREGRHEAEGWRVRKDGSRFWASVVIDAVRDESGALIGFAKITRDITERQAAQEALRESERQFRLLVQSVTDYSLFMLDPNGIVSSWNSGAERIKGYRSDEIVGQHFSRFYTENERQAGLPARALHLAATEGRFEAEGWRLRKDGSSFWANVVIDAIRDDAGKLIGFAKITRDITEKRDAQIALDQAQAQRAHAQKMEALGQLTGGVAHDFNNLLMVVSGYTRLLRKLVGSDPKGQRAIEAIDMATKQGESLTRQLLSFSRRQPVNARIVPVHGHIETVCTLLASSTGSAVKVATSLPPDIWPVRIDVSEFELALLNLTLNARDAMPHGGVITITTENVVLRAGDTPGPLQGEFVAITVGDSGTGIPADVLPRIFEPFFTTKRSTKGTGLGLAQVHSFVHQSGGTVTVRSTLGEGTSITLYLPRAQGAAEGAAAPEQTGAAGSGAALLVEDNPEVAEVSAGLVEQAGYSVRIVENAQMALGALSDTRYDLLVSDIVMAGDMDGLALAREVRKTHPTLPIVLVTGYSHAPTGDSGFTVLRKPYEVADLNRAIAKATSEVKPPDNLVDLRARREMKSERS